MNMRQVQEYRDQARRHRKTAESIVPDDVRASYLHWADDLEQRADNMEAAIAAEAGEAA